MRATDIAWAAGLFEGEGSITSHRRLNGRRPGVRMQLGSTDEDVVRRFHAIVGVGGVRGPLEPKSALGKKLWWQWSCGARADIGSLLAEFWIYLGARRRAQAMKATVAPAVRHHNREKRDCKRGHLLEGDNLYLNPRGQRECKTCRREAKRRSDAKPVH